MIGNKGGKSLQDRKLAAEVRSLTLNKIKTILEKPRVDMTDSDRSLHDGLLLKLAGTVLPRLNETTGPSGGPVETHAVSDKKYDEMMAVLEKQGLTKVEEIPKDIDENIEETIKESD